MTTPTLTEEAKKTIQKKRWGKIFESPAFWVVVVTISFGLPLFQSLTKNKLEPIPVFSRLEKFDLINQDGRKVSEKDFLGSVLVVNFIFTSCPDMCPLLTQQMAKIQERVFNAGAAVQLVSVSVDPKTDTPEKLHEYGQKYGANFHKWSFLTGDTIEAMQKVVVDGFKVAFTKEASKDADLFTITHGEHFVIVDQLGQIRKYTQARNDAEINEILRTIAILANTRPQLADAPKQPQTSTQ